MSARFDSTRWGSTQPGVVRWPGTGSSRAHRAANARGGRIRHGRLPTEGSGDLRGHRLAAGRRLRGPDAGHDRDPRAALWRGPSADDAFPLLTGARWRWTASRNGAPVPRAHATFDYANQRMTGHAEPDGACRLLVADEACRSTSPSAGAGAALPDGPVALDLQADPFPLESLPEVSPRCRTWRDGCVEVAVRGTRAAPGRRPDAHRRVGRPAHARPQPQRGQGTCTSPATAVVTRWSPSSATDQGGRHDRARNAHQSRVRSEHRGRRPRCCSPTSAARSRATPT
jgi:hypothetical protein